MTLPSDWLAFKGISEGEAARLFGVSTQVVHYAVSGQRLPSFPILLGFHKLSDGAVGLDDWANVLRKRKGRLPPSRIAGSLRAMLKPKKEKK